MIIGYCLDNIRDANNNKSNRKNINIKKKILIILRAMIVL